jgi:hypothetical protein
MSEEPAANQSPELRTFRIEWRRSPSERYNVLGRLVVDTPRAEYLQLVEKYPPGPVSQVPDRRVDEAIRALIGQTNMAKLICYLGLPKEASVEVEPRWPLGVCRPITVNARRPSPIKRAAPSSGSIRSENTRERTKAQRFQACFEQHSFG